MDSYLTEYVHGKHQVSEKINMNHSADYKVSEDEFKYGSNNQFKLNSWNKDLVKKQCKKPGVAEILDKLSSKTKRIREVKIARS